MTKIAALPALLLSLAAACGNVQNPEEPDAAPVDETKPDAAPDAKPDDPKPDPNKPGPVKVIALSQKSDDKPQVGAPIVFLDAKGAVVSATSAGADGSATAEMAPGGSVTVVWRDADRTQLVTVVDVRPGDTIVLGTKSFAKTVTRTGLTVTFDAVRFGTSYKVHSRCNDAAAVTATVDPLDASLRKAFLRMTSFCDADNLPQDVVITTTSNLPGDTRLYAATASVPAGTSAIELDLFESSWRPVAPMQAIFTKIDKAAVADLSVFRKLRRGTFAFHTAFGLGSNESGVPVSITGGTIGVDDNEKADMLTTVSIDGIPNYLGQSIEDVRPVGDSYGFDVSTTLLPWFEPKTFDPATRTATWNLRGAGEFDVMVLENSYTRTVNTTKTEFEWRLIAPSSTGTYQFPELPDLADVLPKAGDVAYVREGRLYDIEGKTYRDLVGRIDVDGRDLSSGRQTAPRTRISSFACGGRACP